MINKAEILIILRYLKPKDRDGFFKVISNFSFIGIMLGVATLIIVMSLMNGFRIDLLDKLLGYQPHISYLSQGNYNSEKNIILKYSKENQIKITDINLVKNSQALILTKKENFGVLIKSFHNNEMKNNYFLKNSIIKGKVDNNGIGIGLEMANKLSINVGDTLTLLSSSTETTPFGLVPKQLSFSISYIFNTGMFEFDNNYIITNLDQGALLSKKQNEIEIKLSDPDKAIFFTKILKKRDPDNLVYSWVDTNKTFFDALNVERNVMFIILTLIIIIAAFNIISVLTILIKNKSKEIAIMRSIGFLKTSICKIFIFSGAAIGFLGIIFGVFFGIVISHNLENIRVLLNKYFNINIFPPEIYFLNQVPSHVNYSSVVFIALLSFIIVIIASIFPAISASKLDPVKNLKND